MPPSPMHWLVSVTFYIANESSMKTMAQHNAEYPSERNFNQPRNSFLRHFNELDSVGLPEKKQANDTKENRKIASVWQLIWRSVFFKEQYWQIHLLPKRWINILLELCDGSVLFDGEKFWKEWSVVFKNKNFFALKKWTFSSGQRNIAFVSFLIPILYILKLIYLSICPVGWGCRIYQLHLCRGVRPPPPTCISCLWH